MKKKNGILSEWTPSEECWNNRMLGGIRHNNIFLTPFHHSNIPSFHYKSKSRYGILVLISIVLFILPSCGPDEEELPTPKPMGYFRIDLPVKEYVAYDTPCPFTFQYPVYGKIGPDIYSKDVPCWINLDFPQFRGTLHISYKKVENNLDQFLNESRELAVKHQIKATSMDERIVINDSAKVYGLIYEIGGNAASSLQFYLTDSTHHFLRCALYFNTRPNQDSIEPVYNFIKQDVEKMIGSFRWK